MVNSGELVVALRAVFVSLCCLLHIAACSNARDTTLIHRATVTQERWDEVLMNGDNPSFNYWRLSDSAKNAVVSVVSGAQFDHLCSGVALSATRVLTAAHCVPHPLTPVEIRVGDNYSFASVRVGALTISRLLRLDLALLGVEGLDEHAVSPIAANAGDPSTGDCSVRGMLATRAGFGNSMGNSRVPEWRQFMVEPISFVQSDSIILESHGRRGACRGDSGGPLLGKDTNGNPVVLGILTAGSASCRGTDIYARVDIARDWLSSNGVTMFESVDCGAANR